ncbi:hypothetical protein PoB_001668700, partial [Plakobranchus ocellatus]
QPKIYVFRKSSYFTCAEDYQVIGVDYTLLELDVSKNHTLYSYEKDRGPRFEYKTRDNEKLSKPIHFCTPFTDRQKGFCVKKQSFPNGCSCEQVGVDRFRLKANFTVTAKEMSNGILSLTWPDKRGVLRYDYNLPEVRTRPINHSEWQLLCFSNVMLLKVSILPIKYAKTIYNLCIELQSHVSIRHDQQQLKYKPQVKVYKKPLP